MKPLLEQLLIKYQLQTADDYINALREILQQIILLGLWRSKFFEKAAFYGGTSLRILYGLDRYSEDIDFSLLKADNRIDLSSYNNAIQKELAAFGLSVEITTREKSGNSQIESAFLKVNTREMLLTIGADPGLVNLFPRNQKIKIRYEVDTDPPGGFDTEFKYLFVPLPIAVRTFTLPDLFAGKMHAILFRKWKTRVKGRDWYDLVWFASQKPSLRLSHLEMRMRQSGHWKESRSLTMDDFLALIKKTIDQLNIQKAIEDVSPFLKHQDATDLWSKEFFNAIIEKILFV
ncbi:MAG: nucleotidyl transferase AbiEii/AbiGii toxin family protein [Fidelibacterota bacterium]